MTPQGSSIRGPAGAAPGTTATVEVDSGSEVAVTLPGQPPMRIPVRNGRAQIPVPASASGGQLIQVVVLGRIPPEGITIAVVEPRRGG